MQKPTWIGIDNSNKNLVGESHLPTKERSPKASGSRPDFPPRKRSIPTGFDFDLDEVWWNRLKNRPGAAPNVDVKDPLNRIVPAQYYSRHLVPAAQTNGESSSVHMSRQSGPRPIKGGWVEAENSFSSDHFSSVNAARSNKQKPVEVHRVRVKETPLDSDDDDF